MNTITTIARPSTRVYTACAMFGLNVQQGSRRSYTSLVQHARAACDLDRALERSMIAFVTGPSGSGKSTLLHALGHRLSRREQHVIYTDPHRLSTLHTPIVDLFRLPLARTLKQLARVGLADAMLFPLAPSELSDGQRLRLSIALAMSEADSVDKPTTILADEFASVLDGATAGVLAQGVARWVHSSPGIRFVAATARDEILEAMDPDLLVYQPLLGRARIHRRHPLPGDVT